MKKLLLGLAAVGIIAGVVWYARRGAEGMRVVQGMSAEVVLNPGDFEALPAERYTNFGVTPEGTLLLQSDRALYESGPEGDHVRVVEIATGARSFAVQRSNVIVVHENLLGEVTPDGLRDRVRLPAGDMRVAPAANPDSLFLWSDGSKRLYLLDNNGKLTPWLELHAPIVDVAASMSDSAYVATAREIYSVARDGRSHLAIRLPEKFGAITGLASDRGTGELFFATSDRVYAMRNNEALALAHSIGGRIAFESGSLYVFDPAREMVVRIASSDASSKAAFRVDGQWKGEMDGAPLTLDLRKNSGDVHVAWPAPYTPYSSTVTVTQSENGPVRFNEPERSGYGYFVVTEASTRELRGEYYYYDQRDADRYNHGKPYAWHAMRQ